MFRRVVAALVAVGTAVALHAGPASAAGSSDKKKRQEQIGSQIDTLQSQVEEASAEESNLLGQIDTSRAKLTALTGQVRDLDGKVAIAQHDLAHAEDKLVAEDGALRAATA